MASYGCVYETRAIPTAYSTVFGRFMVSEFPGFSEFPGSTGFPGFSESGFPGFGDSVPKNVLT